MCYHNSTIEELSFLAGQNRDVLTSRRFLPAVVLSKVLVVTVRNRA